MIERRYKPCKQRKEAAEADGANGYKYRWKGEIKSSEHCWCPPFARRSLLCATKLLSK
jgi:hypothetical protein